MAQTSSDGESDREVSRAGNEGPYVSDGEARALTTGPWRLKDRGVSV